MEWRETAGITERDLVKKHDAAPVGKMLKELIY